MTLSPTTNMFLPHKWGLISLIFISLASPSPPIKSASIETTGIQTFIITAFIVVPSCTSVQICTIWQFNSSRLVTTFDATDQWRSSQAARCLEPNSTYSHQLLHLEIFSHWVDLADNISKPVRIPTPNLHCQVIAVHRNVLLAYKPGCHSLPNQALGVRARDEGSGCNLWIPLYFRPRKDILSSSEPLQTYILIGEAELLFQHKKLQSAARYPCWR